MNGSSRYEGQLDEEFLGEARDTVSTFSVLLNNMRSGSEKKSEGMARLSRECTRLRQLAHWADQPLLDLTVRRMESYIQVLSDPTTSNLGDIEIFTFIIESILEGEIDPKTDESEFVRSLPVLRPLDLSDLDHLDIEILLVEPQRTSARLFERELLAGGYRVTTTNRSFEALEMAARTLPDLVMSSLVLDVLSGIDLCRSLAAIERTEKIPFALLTSYAPDHASLKGLPKSAAVINKGARFGDDLADAFQRFGIT